MAQKTKQELCSILVRMPREIKTALAADAIECGASLNDVAGNILATRVGFRFEPSARKPARVSEPAIPDVLLRIPLAGKKKIQVAAVAAKINMTDYINSQIAEHYNIPYVSNGRKRKPWGGGKRQTTAVAASSLRRARRTGRVRHSLVGV